MKRQDSRGESWVMVFMTSPFSVIHEIMDVAVQVSDSRDGVTVFTAFHIKRHGNACADLTGFVEFA